MVLEIRAPWNHVKTISLSKRLVQRHGQPQTQQQSPASPLAIIRYLFRIMRLPFLLLRFPLNKTGRLQMRATGAQFNDPFHQ
jgi:hypothetical protein